MSRTIVLTGAPETAKLDWSEQSLLPATKIKAAILPAGFGAEASFSPTRQTFTARWRQISTEKHQMRPQLPRLEIDSPPIDGLDVGPAAFFSAQDLLGQELAQESAGSDISAEDSRPSQYSDDVEEDEVLGDFYNHSFSIYEAIPSSQMAETQYTPGTPIYESSEDMFSMTTGTPGGIIRSPSQRRLSQAPRPKHLSDLGDIPNAAYLRSIQPQTMTVNLVVGIISIAPARTILTGVGNGRPKKTDLVEMVVGDDTKSGFSISMWLPREMHVNWKDGAQEKPEGARSELRRNLKLLRARDIIMLQNVALSSFQGKVHGQSLRRDVTKVDLLFRRKLNEEDMTGVYTVQNLRMATGKDAQIMKVKRVRDWMVEFVGEIPAVGKGRRRSERGGSQPGMRRARLPDDSQ